MRARHAVATLAVSAAVLGSLTACGGKDPSAAPDGGSSASASAPASPSPSGPSSGAAPSGSPAASPAGSGPDGGHLEKDGLVRALTVTQARAGSAHVAMRLTGSLSVTAEGDVSYRAADPRMRMTMTLGRLGPGRIELRFVRGIVYVMVPRATPAGKFLRIDPKDPTSPLGRSLGNLPALLDPMTSFHAMKAGIRSVRYVGRGDVDGVPTDHYLVTVRSAPLLKGTGTRSVPGTPPTLTYDMWLDDSNLLRRMRFVLAGQRTEMTMSRWGEPVHVEAPPASQVVSAPATAG